MMKRHGGTVPVAVELARESVDPAAVSASRFVELSHAAHKHASNPASGCLEEGCIFAGGASGAVKTQKQRLQKQAKKLKKKIAKAKKMYLENHTEEEFEVLKNESVLDALERENAGGVSETGEA